MKWSVSSTVVAGPHLGEKRMEDTQVGKQLARRIDRSLVNLTSSMKARVNAVSFLEKCRPELGQAATKHDSCERDFTDAICERWPTLRQQRLVALTSRKPLQSIVYYGKTTSLAYQVSYGVKSMAGMVLDVYSTRS